MNESETAKVESNDDMASGEIHEENEMGKKITECLSEEGFDDTPLASRLWPPLTTVKQPIFEMASLVTKLLIDDIRGTIDADHHENFEFDLIVRESTARLNNS